MILKYLALSFLAAILSSADNLCKPFDTLIVFLKDFCYEKLNFEKKETAKQKIPRM